MNFVIADVQIDVSTLVAHVLILDDVPGVEHLKPEIRKLVVVLPGISESTIPDLHALASAQNWAATANGAAYYVNASGKLTLQPKAPNSFCVWTSNGWFDPRPMAEQEAAQWEVVRSERKRLLQASDWTQLPDVPIDTKDAWAAYRQALRDVTDQPDPFNIVWPTAP